MNTKTFQVPQTVYTERTMTLAEVSLVRALFRDEIGGPPPRKVLAIKFIREQYGMSLRESKELCEWLASPASQWSLPS